MSKDCWMLMGQCLETPPEGYYGFVYMITDDLGRMYIGKKAFLHKKKTKLSKKMKKATGKRVSIGTKDSGWLGYWGSCKPLLQYIADRGSTEGFKRQILRLCKDRQSLWYWETAELIKREVLFKEHFWNGNVAGKFFKGKIHE